MTYADLVQPLLERRDLSEEQAREAMHFLIGGEATESQIGGFLLALRVKGCTTRELAAFASVMREKALIVSHPFHDLVDTCGTGGGVPSFNLSTAAAFVAAGAGVRIAKHGNRSMTGLGSAEVLEALGVVLGEDPERLAHQLETVGMAFHIRAGTPSGYATRCQEPPRVGSSYDFQSTRAASEPGWRVTPAHWSVRTRAHAQHGEALRALEAERAILVHGKDGLDEASALIRDRCS